MGNMNINVGPRGVGGGGAIIYYSYISLHADPLIVASLYFLKQFYQKKSSLIMFNKINIFLLL